MFNKKGFTLVEIIVVLVILSILAGISIPAYLKYIDDAKEKACRINRTSLLNYYKKYKMAFDDDSTLKDFVEKDDVLSSQFSKDVKTFVCPSGGVFYVVDNLIKCTKHDNGSSNGNTGGNEETPKTLGDLANVTAVSWLALCDKVRTTGKAEEIVLGSFVSFGGKIYVANKKVTLNPNEARTYGNDISEFKFMTYLDPNRPILGPTNVDKITNTWNVQLNEGAIYQEGTKTYLYIGPNEQIEKPIPPNGNFWVKLDLSK